MLMGDVKLEVENESLEAFMSTFDLERMIKSLCISNLPILIALT